MVLLMCSSGGQTLEPENIMWKDQKNRHGKWYSGGSSWGKQRRQRGRRPGHRTEYSAHVFNVKTSPTGSCPIFPQSTWAPCPKRWDFLYIHVTGCNHYFSHRAHLSYHHHHFKVDFFLGHPEWHFAKRSGLVQQDVLWPVISLWKHHYLCIHKRCWLWRIRFC